MEADATHMLRQGNRRLLQQTCYDPATTPAGEGACTQRQRLFIRSRTSLTEGLLGSAAEHGKSGIPWLTRTPNKRRQLQCKACDV